MKITERLLLGYFLIVALAAWFVLRVFTEEVKPGVKQAMEESLVDTSQILAELATADMKSGNLNHGQFAKAVERYRGRETLAASGDVKKHETDLRIYVTDARGIVVYDSKGEAQGRNYAGWNDVRLTLRGHYGARTTKDDPNDELSAVMYVAAPVMDGKKVMGVLTAAKATASVQPFIDRSRSRISQAGLWLMGGALIIGLFFTWSLSRSIVKLRRYAREMSLGNKPKLPHIRSSELAELANALAEMREKLDGREYVETYVHHLTHEMRSPLTALIGSAELLDENLPPEKRASFTANIREQCQRLKDMIEKVLALAKLEHRSGLEEAMPINLGELASQVIADHGVRMLQRNIICRAHLAAAARTTGEPFLLRQALANLLDNAIEFTPEHGTIDIRLETASGHNILSVQDQGPGIPDYALPRVFERFYSLARPGTQRKSTGLGLPFVREAALLHGGSAMLENSPQGGALARLVLPAA